MAKKKYVRPYRTLYYRDIHAREAAYSSQGHSSTEEGAKFASGGRMVLEQFVKAIIQSKETGATIFTLRRTAAGISLSYGEAEQNVTLRRVK